MNPLMKALFGRADVSARPNLAEFVGAEPGPRMLLVDAATPPAAEPVAHDLPGAVVHRHDLRGEEGLPFQEGDPRRLPTIDGGWERIVLLDAVDGVLHPGYALVSAAEARAPDGRLVLIQQVAPDDIDARGAWNALQRLRDVRHTWTPTRRQVRAMAGDAGFVRESEILWDEDGRMTESVRPDTEDLLRTYLAALEVSALVRDGSASVRRLGLVLRSR